MTRKLIAGATVALTLSAAPALAAKPATKNVKSPGQACRMLRASDEAAFKATYKTFGKCVSEHAKARTRTDSAIKAQEKAMRKQAQSS